MAKIIAVTTALLLLTAGSGLGTPSFLNKDDYPKVDGSTSTQFLQSLVKSKILGTDEVVPHSDTGKSFTNLINGTADLILTARAPTPEEKKEAETEKVELDALPIALDALIFLVNKANPVNDLTLDQIRDIFSGKMREWGKLWPNSELFSEKYRYDPGIISYQRERLSGSEELMRSLIMQDAPIKYTWPTSSDRRVLGTMSAVYINVAQIHRSIGYSIFYYMKNLSRLCDVKREVLEGQQKQYKKRLVALEESNLKQKDPEYWDHLMKREQKESSILLNRQQKTLKDMLAALKDSHQVKIIAVNGIEPSKQTIASRKYPLSSEVYVVIRKERVTGARIATDVKNIPAITLRDWLLSPDGQKVVEESGYIPIKPAAMVPK